MSERKRLWQKRNRDELKRWYEEKVEQGIIDSDHDGGLRNNWSVDRHLICLKT